MALLMILLASSRCKSFEFRDDELSPFGHSEMYLRGIFNIGAVFPK